MTDDKLAKNVNSLFAPKKYGISAQRAAAQEKIKSIDPEKCESRIAIIMDDSGSMSGQPMRDAHDGIQAFTQSCNPMNTSLSIYPLNAPSQKLTINYDILNAYVRGVWATGGTPLYEITQEALTTNLTRAILFSDGCPNNAFPDESESKFSRGHDKTITDAIEARIPLDTVFIGDDHDTRAIEIMKDLADRTGGIFIHFKDTSSLSKNLKYLAPALRAMLMNEEIKAKIQRGETI